MPRWGSRTEVLPPMWHQSICKLRMRSGVKRTWVMWEVRLLSLICVVTFFWWRVEYSNKGLSMPLIRLYPCNRFLILKFLSFPHSHHGFVALYDIELKLLSWQSQMEISFSSHYKSPVVFKCDETSSFLKDAQEWNLVEQGSDQVPSTVMCVEKRDCMWPLPSSCHINYWWGCPMT